MRRLTLLVLVLALVLASSASADPFRFANRAAFERLMATAVVKTYPTRLRGYRVSGIGCAKYGVGRAYCSVVARRRLDVREFTLRVECADDRGTGCKLTLDELT